MLSKTKVQPISFEVNSFMLMSSVLSPGGPKYSVVAEYNLKQA
jgi:2'-5' RNA ligase